MMTNQLRGRLDRTQTPSRLTIDIYPVGGTDRIKRIAPDEKGAFAVDIEGAEPDSQYDVVVRDGDKVMLRSAMTIAAEPQTLSLSRWAIGGRVLMRGEAVVHGRVTTCRGEPVPNLVVAAWDQDLHHVGDDNDIGQRLGRATTNANGEYRIFYRRQQYQETEYRTADVFITVIRKGVKKHTDEYWQQSEVVARSSTRFNVEDRVEINARIPGSRLHWISEYRLYLDWLRTLMAQFGSGDRKATDIAALDDDHLDFLHRERGIPFDHLIAFRQAHQWTGEISEVTEVIYGLLRMGLPARLGGWLTVSVEALDELLRRAIDQCVVTNWVDERHRRVLLQKALKFALRDLLSWPAKPGRSHWSEVLGTILPSVALRGAYLMLYIRVADRDALMDAIRAHNGLRDHAKALAELDWAARAADYIAPVIKDVSLKVALSPEDAADWNEERWAQRALAAGLPAGVEANWLGRRLYRFYQARFGGAAMDRLLVSGALSGFGGFEHASAALEADDIDFMTADWPALANRLTGTDAQKTDTIERLMMVQRLTRLGVPTSHLAAMADKKLTTSKQISSRTVEAFIAESGLPPTQALKIHSKAAQIEAIRVGALLGLSTDSVNDGADSIPAPNGDKWGKDRFADVFGGGTRCACDDERSALSPSAYFFDLVAFTAQIDGGAAALSARRPDLVHIKLNDENAKTPLPSIDMSIEVLEDAARSQLGDPPDTATYQGRQTTWPAEALRFAPEYPSMVVYDAWAGTGVADRLIHPWDLFYNVPYGEAGAYLPVLGTTRDAILHATGAPPASPALAALGIAPEARALILLDDAAFTLQGVYGAGATLDILRVAEGLMDATSLSFPELYTLLATAFVSGGDDLTAFAPSLESATLHQCDPSRVAIPNLQLGHLRRIHRFLRLWRGLDWSMRDLDRAITVLGADSLDEDCLVAIGKIRRLQRRLELPVEVLIAFSGPLENTWTVPPFRDADARRTLFERAFRDERAARLAGAGNADVVATNAIAYGLKVDVATAISVVGKDTVDIGDNADIDKLAELFRWAKLATALKGWSASDLIDLQTWSGQQAFSTDPQTTLDFLELVDLVEQTQRRFRELRELFGPNRATAPSPETLDGWVDAIADLVSALEASVPEAVTRKSALEQLATLVDEDALGGVRAVPAAQATLTHAEQRTLSSSTGLADETLDADGATVETCLRVLVQKVVWRGWPQAAATLTADLMDGEPEALEVLLVGLSLDTETLLTVLEQTPADDASRQNTRTALRHLQVAANIATHWSLSGADITAIDGLAANAGFSGLPFVDDFAADWAAGSFDRWAGFARLLSSAGRRRAQFFAMAQMSFDGAPHATVMDALGDVWRVERTLLDDSLHTLAAAYGLAIDPTAAFDADLLWVDERLWALHRLTHLGHRLDILPSQLALWASDDISAQTARDLRLMVSAASRVQRYGEDKVASAANTVRRRKRDALVSFLLSRPAGDDRPWYLPRHVSDRYLIDVEMEPCAETSRLRAAMSAVQRLVRQAVALDEPAMLLTTDQIEQWQVTSRYRLWEARRKVLLYPENWLRHGRHLDRSGEYDEFQNALMQGQLSREEARESLHGFVESLHVIGHLEVVGLYHEQEIDTTLSRSRDIVHIIGRTPTEPRRYYHRTYVEGAYWTPWTHIEVEIESEHVTPVVFNRRLYIFWPEFRTEVQEVGIPDYDEKSTYEDTYSTFQMAHTELTTKGWKSKVLSKQVFSTRFDYGDAAFRVPHPWAVPYAEVRRMFQMAQAPQTMTFRPTLAENGDLVLELYARLETIELLAEHIQYTSAFFKMTRALSDIASGAGSRDYGEIFDTEVRANVEAAHLEMIDRQRVDASSGLGAVEPAFPVLTISGVRSNKTADYRLCGRFQLTPDGLWEIKNWRQLSSDDRGKRLEFVSNTTARYNGLRESHSCSEDGLYLELDGYDQMILGKTPGNPSLVVSRQESHPTHSHPVVCNVRGYTLFAEKLSAGLDAPIDGGSDKAGREYLREAITSSLPLSAVSVSLDLVRTQAEYGTFGESISASTRPGGRRASAALLAGLASSWDESANTVMGGQWRFVRFYHSFTMSLLRQIAAGVQGLFNRELQQDPVAALPIATDLLDFERFDPSPARTWSDHPEDGLDFRLGRPFSAYNWELFYHAPLGIAHQLTQNGRYDEAKRWLQCVFDPEDPAGYDAPENAWRFAPFVAFVQEGGVSLLNAFSDPTTDPFERRSLQGAIRRWRRNPFNPHAVAVFRPQAYMRAALFQYVDNLLEWGDSLFEHPSLESVEQSATIYEEAAAILGLKPRNLGPLRTETHDRTITEILAETGTSTSVAVLENMVSAGPGESPVIEREFWPEFRLDYFCLPVNPRLQRLRDTVADRLFKLHHCLDLLGRPRRLPLYDPPIDPGLLADGIAAGLNLSQIIMDGFTPRPHYRFQTLLGIANRFTDQVRALGQAMLSTMEKRDAEALSKLRVRHERAVLHRATEIRKRQVDDATAQLQGVQATRKLVEFRQKFYASREFMIGEEVAEIALSVASTLSQILAQAMNASAGASAAVPDFIVGAAGISSPVALTMTGGGNVSRVPQALATAAGAAASLLTMGATISGTMGRYRRRQDDWDFQAEAAGLELRQVDKQILAAEIRLAIAEKELENHVAQLEEAKAVETFLKNKGTRQQLYDWMVSELSRTHHEAYRLASNLARQAQRAMQYELMTDTAIIGSTHWDAAKHGLMSGERLGQELRLLEAAYLESNKRLPTRTKEISLALVAPGGLLALKATGACDFSLPEDLFDRDAPGQYRRRIQRMAVSVPAVVGPFSGVNGRLVLKRSAFRIHDLMGGAAYDLLDWDNPADGFRVRYATDDVLHLSTGRRDTGMATDAEGDGRYRLFEGAGLVSDWHLEIPQADNRFDITTVSDVVLHVEYTAVDGSTELRDQARIAAAEALPRRDMLSLRHEQARDWSAYLRGDVDFLTIAPSDDHDVQEVMVFVRATEPIPANSLSVEIKTEVSGTEHAATFEMIATDAQGAFKTLVLDTADGVQSQLSTAETWKVGFDGIDRDKLVDAIVVLGYADD